MVFDKLKILVEEQESSLVNINNLRNKLHQPVERSVVKYSWKENQDELKNKLRKEFLEQVRKYILILTDLTAKLSPEHEETAKSSWSLPKEKDNEIKEIFKSCSDAMRTNELPSLINAVKLLGLLEGEHLNSYLNDSQKYEINFIKKILNDSLSQWGKKLTDWFDENELEKAGELSFTSIPRKYLFRTSALCANLSSDAIANINDRDKRCLMAVYQYMNSTRMTIQNSSNYKGISEELHGIDK